jgi:peptidoglycan-associated lipoprotein
MTFTRSRWIPVAIVALAVAGCSGNKTKDSDTNSAAVEDRGLSSDEMNDIDSGAETQGLDDGDLYSSSALGDPNDPDGPLSVRVIYFDLDSSNVRADFRTTIEAHAAYLAGHSDVSISLEGHADERGSREYNLALGERRALAVRKQLVLLGASAGQAQAVSYGEERPDTEGSEEESYALNRRVEIIY